MRGRQSDEADVASAATLPPDGPAIGDAGLGYARPGALRGRRLSPWGRILAAGSLLILVALVASLALPAIRGYVLGTRGNYGGMCSDNWYNLSLRWRNVTAGDGIRGVLYPTFLNTPIVWPDYQNVNTEGPPVIERDGEFFYRGRKIAFPRGRNIAIIGIDGTVSFLPGLPRSSLRNYREYPVQVGPFHGTARSFEAFEAEALREARLLPDWAVPYDALNRRRGPRPDRAMPPDALGEL